MLVPVLLLYIAVRSLKGLLESTMTNKILFELFFSVAWEIHLKGKKPTDCGIFLTDLAPLLFIPSFIHALIGF